MLDVGNYMRCEVCGKPGEYGYCCPRCWMMVHEKCATVFDSTEITDSCHARHSLKLLTEGAPGYTDLKCHLCGKDTGNILYHCDICKFNLDMVCAIKHHRQHKVIPAALSNMKVHDHTLTLIPRLMPFVCDGCGEKGDRSPYFDHYAFDPWKSSTSFTLPRRRLLWYDDHPLTLCYGEEATSGKYWCDICESETNPKTWFYTCYDCGVTLHVFCVLGDISSITMPLIHGSHPHPLLYLEEDYYGDREACQGMMIIHSLFVTVKRQLAASIGVIYAKAKQIQRPGSTPVMTVESLYMFSVCLVI
ncbi:hypothetical protein DY000_02025453 [Brassica cretica]|uniref:DC1 domain-containing protein n=1 Tax=Brassica cretica TaxID=69181 RepID=A0ABQ7E192_BRACR|nr:hypothetical protein DY000_02025453 [Brassica cretica]